MSTTITELLDKSYSQTNTFSRAPCVSSRAIADWKRPCGGLPVLQVTLTPIDRVFQCPQCEDTIAEVAE